MREIWLRSNRRVLLMGMIPPALLFLIGVLIAVWASSKSESWARIVGFILAGFGFALLGTIVLQLRQPRMAHENGEMLFFLRAGGPFRVPVNVVECFFFSSGTGQVPGAAGQQLPLRNLVVRLAEKATEYHHRDVKPAFGRWDDGYVTIHGAWCEPLNLELVKRLNEQLASAQKSSRPECAES